MVLKYKKWLLPLLIGGLVLLQVGCKTPAKQGQGHPIPAEGKHWGYTGDTGPEYWYTLDPAYAIAKDGKAQSPIDIITGDLVKPEDLSKPEFHYTGIPFKVENNGHTIELVPSGTDDIITLDGVSYTLRQAHFHAPSEHTINGEFAAMEIHLVHRDPAENIAVVGILITPGTENAVLKEAFAKLPKSITQEDTLVSLEEPIDLTSLLDEGISLYRYDGSLTTPPCTEGVKWSVVDKPLELSQAQIDAFTAIYSGNNRPIQNLNDRKVYLTQ